MPHSESSPEGLTSEIGVSAWAATLDALPVPTLGVDHGGTIVAANEAAALLLGCARAALVGTAVDSLVPLGIARGTCSSDRGSPRMGRRGR
jgi:nitrogen-specific signal transduction histidine kinase